MAPKGPPFIVGGVRRLLLNFSQASRGASEEFRNFALGISHDLREPLRAICCHAELLKKDFRNLTESDTDRLLTFICEAANGMQNLLDEMVAFAAPDTEAEEPSEVHAEDALQSALALLKSAIVNAKAVVTHDPIPCVIANPEALTRVFQNLISNALKYRSGAQPKIHVGCRLGEVDCIFSVSDNGIGIDPRHREDIFLPLKRLHSQSEYPGTGIGLAICRRIVESHGGRIWLQSVPGSGSIFYFTLRKAKQAGAFHAMGTKTGDALLPG